MWEKSDRRVFYCCCPLYFGIRVIAFFVFVLTVAYTFNAFMLFFNQTIDAYFPIVLILLYIPLYIAFVFYILYTNSDKKSDRYKLFIGTLLVILSVILACIWTCYYINYLYKRRYVWVGTGDMDEWGNYVWYTKKQYTFSQIINAVCVILLFIYFAIAASSWEELGEEDEEKKKDMDDMMMDGDMEEVKME